MTQYQSIKLRIKIGFCVAILTILSISIYHLFSIWQDGLRNASLTLAHSVRMANLLIEDALIDGSKFLDIAKLDLELDGTPSRLDGQKIEKSLKKSVAKFKLSSWFNVYGNLLFINSSGDVVAQTAGPLSQKINVSDRYYFQTLKEDSSQSIVIGPEVRGRSNGRVVFHLARPILNAKGDFDGLLLIQINSAKFKADLVHALGDGYEALGLYLNSGKLIFSLNDGGDNKPLQLVSEAALAQIALAANADDIFFLPSQNTFGFKKIVANSVMPRLGAHVVGETSTQFVWAKTLSWGLKFLTLIIVSCLLVGFFAYRLLASISRVEIESNLAIHDALTKLPNRRYFDEIFPKIQGDCRRSHSPLSILFIDIDHFKKFNDLHGHECGDVVLKIVARSISQIQKRPLDFFCRWGGEEFLFILPDTDKDGAIHYAEQILGAVSSQEIRVEDGDVVHVTVSVGIATDPDGNHNLSDDLIKNSDDAMYLAKQAGRNRYEVYSA